MKDKKILRFMSVWGKVEPVSKTGMAYESYLFLFMIRNFVGFLLGRFLN